MKFLVNFHQAREETRTSLTATDSAKMLKLVEGFFQNGHKWTKGAYHRGDGTKCLVGAVQHLRANKVVPIDDAEFWLRKAIEERRPGSGMAIESYNDSCASYQDIATLLGRAKQLATARAAANLPPPAEPVAVSPKPLALSHETRIEIDLSVKQPELVRAKPR
jgi:hypothetical protein